MSELVKAEQMRPRFKLRPEDEALVPLEIVGITKQLVEDIQTGMKVGRETGLGITQPNAELSGRAAERAFMLCEVSNLVGLDVNGMLNRTSRRADITLEPWMKQQLGFVNPEQPEVVQGVRRNVLLVNQVGPSLAIQEVEVTRQEAAIPNIAPQHTVHRAITFSFPRIGLQPDIPENQVTG